ncbi:MAG: hypothetical protein AAF518_07115 [Spirochaetota bacterium]
MDIWVKLFQPIFKVFPSIGVNATTLGKVIFDVGIEGFGSIILSNRDILEYHTIPKN